jgi:LmbE family N-acetylglucosaminyl deacetylase
MISCNLTRVKRVLCVGAHSDDIEIGCGGTLLRMIERSKSIETARDCARDCRSLANGR